MKPVLFRGSALRFPDLESELCYRFNHSFPDDHRVRTADNSIADLDDICEILSRYARRKVKVSELFED